MLNEFIEYSEYTDISFKSKRLRYGILNSKGLNLDESKSLGGLSRVFSIIARRFCYYDNDSDNPTPLCAYEALKSWCGIDCNCEMCDRFSKCEKKNEIGRIYSWFQKYILTMMKECLEKIKICKNNSDKDYSDFETEYIALQCFVSDCYKLISNHKALDLTHEDIFSEFNKKYNSASTAKLYGCFLVLKNIKSKSADYLNNLISNDINADCTNIHSNTIKFDSIISTAIDLGPLSERYIVVKETNDIIKNISPSKADKVLKVLAEFLINQEGNSKTAVIRIQNVINWFNKGDKFYNDKETKKYFCPCERNSNKYIIGQELLNSNYKLISSEGIDEYKCNKYIIYRDQGQAKYFSRNLIE
ncbi:MAG: hypothetical protein PUE46_03960 [Eubacteriales bacterium]|nr:hypothetical protein [Eubacteriales bacterium]